MRIDEHDGCGRSMQADDTCFFLLVFFVAGGADPESASSGLEVVLEANSSSLSSSPLLARRFFLGAMKPFLSIEYCYFQHCKSAYTRLLSGKRSA